MSDTTMLLIMDGFGIAAPGQYNAVSSANTPNIDRLLTDCPNTLINASGEYVGLPEGQMGNSEVGHTNIGAGRVVWQELSKITNSIKTGEFFKNEELCKVMEYACNTGCTLHLAGLLSDGGVHSHIRHLFALIDMAASYGIKDVQVHCILDGRDVPPSCAETYLQQLDDKLRESGCGRIATISGRFYTMDRDKRWDRVRKAYDCLTLGEGFKADHWQSAMKDARGREETDEFVSPVFLDGAKTIKSEDAVIFFNFRPDRAREITRSLTDPQMDGFERRYFPQKLYYLCFTSYDATIPNVHIAFKPQSLENTLGKYISSLGRTQLRIAETEKYAHVTFFFNGGIEEPYAGEERILVPSPKVATYDMQPEMSALPVTDKVIECIEQKRFDLIIMNLANCDMVGHTGSMEAAVRAVETVDACVGRISSAIKAAGGILMITADHGNAESMMEDGHPMTAHTTNLVPLIIQGAGSLKLSEGGALCDLAPTLLSLMGLEQPSQMSGKNLIL